MKVNDDVIISKASKLAISSILALINPASVPSLIEGIADTVADIGIAHTKANRVTVEKLCKKIVPEYEKDYRNLVIAATEICISQIDWIASAYNSETLSTNLSKSYLQVNNKQYGEAECVKLSRYLPALLQKVIYSIQEMQEEDPDFQIKWKSFICEKINAIQSTLNFHEKTIANHEERISRQERLMYAPTAANFYDEYTNRWSKALFLDDILLYKVYQLPHYTMSDLDDEYSDLDTLLQETLTQCNDFRKRMLVVLGHPGSGKSTLISYILNNCIIADDRVIRVYRFSSLEIDWRKRPENIPQLILNSLGIEKEDLSNSVLILDGLDEVDMQNRQVDFLAHLYKQWTESKSILRFSLFVTCRRNRIESLDEIPSPHIELLPFDEDQIISFTESYLFEKGESTDSSLWNLLNNSEHLRAVIGIPLILYMTLALGIDVKSDSNLCEVYNQIFSFAENSIYFRGRYDHPHEITSNEAEKIHTFSREIAIWIWGNNPDDATVPKDCYEELAKRVCKDETGMRDLLVGQYFMEGKNGAELYFVHRSIYEYFVALYIFDEIKLLQEAASFPKGIFDNAKSSALLKFASLIGLHSLSNYPEIQEYLTSLMQAANYNANDWITFFNLFLNEGFIDVISNRKAGGIIGIGEEANRFHNLIWVVRNIITMSGAMHSPYSISNNLGQAFYLGLPFDGILDFSNLNVPGLRITQKELEGSIFYNANMEHAELIALNLAESDFERSNLLGTCLFNSVLSGANLLNANLRNVDLRSADLSGANLTNANLSFADLTGANLMGADLSGAIMDHTKLEGAYLEEAIFVNANLTNLNLSDRELNNVNFSGVIMDNVIFANSSLRNASLQNATICNSNFENVQMANCSFQEATIRKTNMTHASMPDITIQSAKIEDCNMRNADLSNADFQRATILSTHFGSAILDNASFVGATMNGINFRSAELYYADFTDTTIDNANASYGGFDNVIGGDGKANWQIKWVMDEPDIATAKDDSDIIPSDDPEEDYWIVNNWNSLDPFFRRDNYWDY